jgi:hypothetical protein
MKKLIFTNLPLQTVKPFVYICAENSSIGYDKEVSYCINAVLARTLTKDDKAKVVLLKTLDLNGNCHTNEANLKKELDGINQNIGADIEYKVIENPYKETSDMHKKMLLRMADEIENGVEITADITFGPKPLPIILFNILSFAERFCGASIKYIVYGKVDFDRGIAKNPEFFDVTPLYYLNSLNNKLECKDMAQAKEVLKKLIK